MGALVLGMLFFLLLQMLVLCLPTVMGRYLRQQYPGAYTGQGDKYNRLW